MAKTLPTPRPPRRAVFSEPGFTATYAVGVVWSLCRWGIGFLGAYVVAEATGSPRLVQLTGALLWAPLLLTGVIGGVISDRFSRRTLLLVQFGVLAPLTAGLGLLSLGGPTPLVALYVYMVVAGVGWVIDMTARRALIYDLVGPEHINNAMAFEGLASAVGFMAGTVAGGALIGAFGAAGAYLALSVVIAVGALLLIAVPPTPRPVPVQVARPSLRSELKAGLGLIGRWPALASALGATALINFFHFSYFPIVPVIAQRLGATPFSTGLLAAASGAGMAVGSFVVLRGWLPRGVAYGIGSVGGFVFLLGFAIFDHYWLVFASLFLAASFAGLFAATQSALVLTAVDDHMRGRAMGLLTMAIGMLPLGMAALGELSELIGPRAAVVTSNVIGVAVLLAFFRARPQILRVK